MQVKITVLIEDKLKQSSKECIHALYIHFFLAGL